MSKLLYPEQIYDLDSISLEEKTQELQKHIKSLSNCPASLRNTLELARLQIAERLSIEQFGLQLDEDLKLFEKYRMYPCAKTIEVQPAVPKKQTHTSSHRALHKQPEESKIAMFLDVLKRTQAKQTSVVICKSSNMVVNRPNKEKPKKQKPKERPKEQPRTSISNRQPSRSKVSLPIKQNIRYRESMLRTEQHPMRSEKVPEIQTERKNEERQVPANKISFIQNDIYDSDDETIPTSRSDYGSKVELPICQFQTQINNQQKSEPEQIDQMMVVMKEQPIQKLEKQQKITQKEDQKPTTIDIIDYFRLTVPKVRQQKAKQSEIEEIIMVDEVRQQSIQNIIQEEIVVETQNQQIPTEINVADNLEQQKQQNQLNQFSLQNQLKNAKSSAKITRKTIEPIFKPRMPNQIVKMMSQLPPIVTQYHELIPSFHHLFHPNAEIVPLVWQLIGMLKQHLGKVRPSQAYKPNLTSNMQQFQAFTNMNSNKIRLYGDKVDLDLQEFEERDCIARMRANGEIESKEEKQILYYRVVKTKQEVYDIMTSTFNRTADWAELPHGLNLGFSWNMLWTWAKPQIEFKKLLFFQKVNHFPHNKHISRKDMLKKNLEKIKRLGPKTQSSFDIMPESYLLPGENAAFLEKYLHYKEIEGYGNLWIMKPVGQSRGRGISLISSLQDVVFSEPVVLQKYLKNPLLLDGYKFDMRIYVLLTAINPLQLFIYKQGFARLSTQKFTLRQESLSNNFIHLTNFAIQRENYTVNGFSLGGTKISLKMLKQKLKNIGIDWSNIWTQIKQIVIKSCIAVMNEVPSNNNCFELFGYDIIIDDQKKCWLLQVNSSPSLEREFLLDEIIKQQLIDDTVALLDVMKFDRARLLQVLERRALEMEGRKSLISTNNNTIAQLNRDLHYILNGKPIRKYGQVQLTNNNYEMLAPGDQFMSLVKIVQSYKLTSLIKK